MILMDLVKVLEDTGLDSATAETIASMAQSKPIDEAKELLQNMVSSPLLVQPYLESRRKSELKKLAIKPDSQGGLIKDGRVHSGVTRNGITVVSEPVKNSKSQKSGSNSTDNVSVSDKVDSVKDLEAALKSSSINREDRKSCDCMGSKHGSLEMAPNCLNCGRVVCKKEGMGPCLFCEQPLLPNEQIHQVLQILESQKMDVISTMSKKALAAAGISVPKKSQESQTSLQLSQSSAKAQANLDRLSSYQAEDAVRTRIIDQSGDVDLPSSGVNQWASPEEQAEQSRKQQQQLRRLEHERKIRSGTGRKVLSIDVRGNKIYSTLEDEQFISEDEDAELIGSGNAEPVNNCNDADEKSTTFFDLAAFSKQRRFDSPNETTSLSHSGNTSHPDSGHPEIIRDPDEFLAY